MKALATYLAIGIGSGLGGICRYAAGAFFVARYGPGLPWGTFCINVSGSFLIGLVAEFAQTRAMGLDPLVCILLTAGFLGGFTTFSSFSYETVTLANGRELEAIPRLCAGQPGSGYCCVLSRHRRSALAGYTENMVFLLLAALNLTATVPSYTFHMQVAMAMRHFPWLHFHMDGEGEYLPPQSYAVHFDHVPWFFPKKHNDIDLSMLDPVMWPQRFAYVQTGKTRDLTMYELHSLNDSDLRDAIVALGPKGAARSVRVHYADGTTIDMHVHCNKVDGFFLPLNLSADIDEPHMALSAQASFDDYVMSDSDSAG